jgi:hypothetical protein
MNNWKLKQLIRKVEQQVPFGLTNPECWLTDGASLVRIDQCDW